MKNPHFKPTNSLTHLVLCCFHDEFSIHVDNLTDKERSFDVRPLDHSHDIPSSLGFRV